MRKQTKWAVILGAAAVMTFGACMTSFAATGWVEEDGTWYFYDKDEEPVTEVWKKAADQKQYYLGEDGAMVTDTWIDGDFRYYTDSNGARVTSQWKLMYGYDDDDAEDESWFWFDANGKMALSKKVAINGKTYYFDEEGKMMTGWVDTVSFTEAEDLNSNTVYCLEDGTRVVGWAELYEPGDEDEEDLYWYNFSSKGEPRINKKQTISGKSYLFDSEGKMISGWAMAVESSTTVGDTTTTSTTFVAIDDDTKLETNDYDGLYYCGKSDDGAVKKSTWVKSVTPTTESDDTDADQYWYYLGKDGILYTANNLVEDNAIIKAYKIKEKGSRLTKDSIYDLSIKKIGTKVYGFKGDGIMVDGLVKIDTGNLEYKEGIYYFGSDNDGSLKTGSVTLTDDDNVSYSYFFAKKADDDYSKGQGVTGVYSSKVYHDGLYVTAKEGYEYGAVIVGGKVYIVKESGNVLTNKSSTYTSEYNVKYKIFGDDVHYTTGGTAVTDSSPKVDSSAKPNVLHYDDGSLDNN